MRYLLMICNDEQAYAALSPEESQANLAAYEAAGIQHVLYALDRGDIEAWLLGVERVAGVVGLAA